MDELEVLGKAIDKVMGYETHLPSDFSNGNHTLDAQDMARIAQETWLRTCRQKADVRKKLVMDALSDSRLDIRLLVSLYVEAERDHAAAQAMAGK